MLKRLGVPHALIGGWAAVAWGVVRATKDLDMLVLVDKAGKSLLGQSFEKLGYRLEWRRGGFDDPIPELLRLNPREPGQRPEIDILFASKSFDLEALNRTVSVNLSGWIMPVLRPEDLIAMKLSAGGPVDFEDAKQLLRVQASRLDQKLLESCCKQLRVHHALQRIKIPEA